MICPDQVRGERGKGAVYEFRIVTLFPELFNGFIDASLVGKARQAGILSIDFVKLRDFTHDKHKTVDDAPYGGGLGMVMKPAPVFEALGVQPPCHKILMTPQGRPLTQAIATDLAKKNGVLVFCGRYEGVDERVRHLFDDEISLGDFVLNGGEVAAMALIETVSRLVPGVIGKVESTVEESHSAGVLEYPQYTRPEIFEGQKVPEVLLSGNHKRIAQWRRGQSLLRTRIRRPDLYKKLELSEDDQRLLKEIEEEKN